MFSTGVLGLDASHSPIAKCVPHCRAARLTRFELRLPPSPPSRRRQPHPPAV